VQAVSTIPDIAFDVYDHYGEPRFSKSDTVLLFVLRRSDGSWGHVKYRSPRCTGEPMANGMDAATDYGIFK